jgi:membrane protease YdiL (CAAX protease family)
MNADPGSTLNFAANETVMLHQPAPWRALGWLLVIAVLIVVALIFVGLGFGVYLGIMGELDGEQAPRRLQEFMGSSLGFAVVMLAQTVAILIGLRFAADFPGQPWPRTLALDPVSPIVVGKWLLWWLLMMVAVVLVSLALGANEEPFMTQLLSNPHWLMLLMVSVAAPVGEELLFRGYLFRAFRHTWLGFSGTLLLTSLLFASLHMGQYGWYGVAQTFVLALLLGFARERTGSVLTPIAIHMAQNTLASLALLQQ